ncbi:hypothetical protein H0H93_016484 [Arthromyces matolae]|nr:hypothetical protein H0H93_016484 [Arthromyces matolae]
MLAFLAQALILALLGSVAAEPFTGMTCGSHLSQETVATMDKHFQENKVETVSKADLAIPVAGLPSLNDAVGGPGDLHVYTVGTIISSHGSLLGYASFPFDYAHRPIDDGVVIIGASLPGGNAASYNLGKGGCSEPGDYVFDTPPEASPASGCAAPRHSCSESVLDPIHNFMDSSYDACRNQFTPGQVARLRQQISIYRGLY